jgi:hypothetical protein
MKRIITAAAVCGILFAACGGGDDLADQQAAEQRAAEQRAAEQRAETAAKQLVGTLLGEVQRAMKEGGPASAVRTCAEKAQPLTDKVAAENMVRLRRVTDRPRNPVDAPDDYERAVLRRFQDMADAGTLEAGTLHSEVVTIDGRKALRYMKPITIKKPCLACHAPEEQLDAEVRAAIAERYPEDRATGYAAGDLRGAISVTVPFDRLP